MHVFVVQSPCARLTLLGTCPTLMDVLRLTAFSCLWIKTTHILSGTQHKYARCWLLACESSVCLSIYSYAKCSQAIKWVAIAAASAHSALVSWPLLQQPQPWLGLLLRSGALVRHADRRFTRVWVGDLWGHNPILRVNVPRLSWYRIFIPIWMWM